MKVSALQENELTRDMIDRIIFENIADNFETADCIMVLGSKKAALYRVPVAVKLYKANRAPKILMCGGKIIAYHGQFAPEAQLMQGAALRLGIPEKDILQETVSMTTKENMICASLVLERNFHLCNIKKIILVTGDYHMRRSLLMAQTYLPAWITFIPCPVTYEFTGRNNWYRTDRGSILVQDEAKKIISYIREGSIPDFEL